MAQINSKEYWNERFAEKSWDKNGGPEQTAYFARLFLDNAPQWLVRYVQEQELEVLDLGCAQGEGTLILSKVWHNVSGADVAESAVETAREKYPHIPFGVEDIFNLSRCWDVVFLSNVLEHFENPLEILRKVGNHARRAVIVMVPFEETAQVDEHVVKFDFASIPIKVGDLTLAYHNNITDYDLERARYFGQQMLLVYSRDDALTENVTLQQSSSIISDWVESGEYRDFKKRYYDMEFQQMNSMYRIGALEYQLQNIRAGKAELESRYAQAEEAHVRQQEAMDRDLKYSWNLLERQRAEAEAALEARSRDFLAKQTELLEKINMLEENMKDMEQSSAEQIALLRAELEQLERQLRQEKEKYDNLYAYSCKRDDELVSITNSRTYQFFVKWLKKPMSITYRIAHKFYRLFRALFTLNFTALKEEVSGPFRKVSLRMKGAAQKRKAFRELKKAAAGKRIVILPPTLDWHMPLFQRPQQLAASYARKENTMVIYLTKNIQYDAVAAVEKAGENLWLVNELYADRLAGAVKGAAEVILSVSWTPNKKYLDILHPDKFIYEYIDELEIFHMYGPEMEADHQMLMKNADVTICTATKLYNQALGLAKNPLLSPNAGDYEFFSKTEEYEISPWIRDIIPGYRCVLGYYGALASWFDYELVKAVAEKHPDWLLVLVGIDYDGTIGKSGIDGYKNIVHVPPQPYKDLPQFLKGFDIATIPFVINEITLSTSPVKLFEYMAAGKPIIASRMPECLKYESVRTYNDVEEFCAYAEEFMAMKSDDAYWEVLKKDALDNTWDARTDEILEALK